MFESGAEKNWGGFSEVEPEIGIFTFGQEILEYVVIWDGGVLGHTGSLHEVIDLFNVSIQAFLKLIVLFFD
jgi:hypothetical protein